jgi:hypothetical protein
LEIGPLIPHDDPALAMNHRNLAKHAQVRATSTAIGACTLVGIAAFAIWWGEPRGATPQGERPGQRAAIAKPTVMSVLVRAKEEAERAEEKFRGNLRREVALDIRRSGNEASFGRYVDDAITAWDADRSGNDVNWQKGRARENEAKHAFRAGDLAQAQLRLRDAGGLRTLPQKCMGDEELCLQSRFLEWELEIGDLAAGLKRLGATKWENPKQYLVMARRVARAYVAAGRKMQAAAAFAELRSLPDLASDEPVLALSLGRALWRLGLENEGRTIVRQVSASHSDPAVSNEGRELAVELACLQLEMDDRDGAIAVLRSLQPVAARLNVDHEGGFGHRLTYAFTRAGLDAEASALVNRFSIDPLPFLGEIATGQADRGEISSAFETLDRLQTYPLPPEGNPLSSRPMFPSFKPLQRTSETGRQALVAKVALAIAVAAARRFEWNALLRADAVGRQSDPQWAEHELRGTARKSALENRIFNTIGPLGSGIFKALGESGHADAAIGTVESFTDPGTRVRALLSIAEGLAGLPDPTQYSEWP